MATHYCEIIAGNLYSDTNGWPSDNEGTRTSRASLNAVVSASLTDDIIILSGGTYILAATFNVSKKLTVRIAKSTDVNYGSHSSPVIIDANSGAFDALSGAAAGSVFDGFSVGGTSIAANYYSIAAGTACTYNNISLFGSKRAVRFGASSVWNNCHFSHDKAGSSFLFYLASGSSVLNNCTFNDIYSFASNGGGAITLNNPLIIGIRYGIINDGTTDITLNNPIVISSGYYSGSNYTFQTTNTGKIYVNYGNWVPNPAAPANTYSGNVIISDSISNQPLFLSGRRPAVVTFGTDDRGNLAYFRDVVSPKLLANGWVGTCAVDTGSLSGSDWEIVTELEAQGHDIAAHGRKLGNNIPDMKGITITYAGASASAVVTINGNVLTLSAPLGSSVGVFDLTSASYDRLTEIVSAINSVSGFTAAKTNTDSSNGFSPYLSDCTSVNIKSTVAAFDYDPAKVWAGELTQSKDDIENNIPGYVCTSFVCPGNATSTAMQAALLSAGFTGSRGGPTPVPLLGLSSINIFNLPTTNIGTYLGSATPAEADVKSRVGSILEYLKWLGGMICFYAHTTSELSDAGWQAVIDEVKKSGVIVLSNRDAVEYIKSQCVDSGDHMAYTKSNWTDQSDYHLQSTSPCLNAGTVIAGITTDLDGNQYPSPNGASIGPYEDYPLPAEGMGPWSHFDGSVNPLTLSDTSPANLLEVKVETN